MEVLTGGSVQQAVAILLEQAQPNVDRFLAAKPMTPEQALLLAALELFLVNLPDEDLARKLEVDFALCHWCLKGTPPVLTCC